MANHIKCADCRYVRQDKNASDYTLKRCKGCEFDCGHKGKCKCERKCRFKHTDNICLKQTLTWTAYECGCPDSEYFKSLLNVSQGGEMQNRITWGGCEDGETRPSGSNRRCG